MYDVLVSVPRTLFNRLAALGVDVDHALRQAGIAGWRSQGPKPSVSGSEYLAFWRTVEALGPPDLGVRFGAEPEPHHLDVASIAALHSRDLGEALRKLQRYKGINCTPGFWTETADGVMRVGLCWELSQSQIGRASCRE